MLILWLNFLEISNHTNHGLFYRKLPLISHVSLIPGKQVRLSQKYTSPGKRKVVSFVGFSQETSPNFKKEGSWRNHRENLFWLQYKGILLITQSLVQTILKKDRYDKLPPRIQWSYCGVFTKSCKLVKAPSSTAQCCSKTLYWPFLIQRDQILNATTSNAFSGQHAEYLQTL